MGRLTTRTGTTRSSLDGTQIEASWSLASSVRRFVLARCLPSFRTPRFCSPVHLGQEIRALDQERKRQANAADDRHASSIQDALPSRHGYLLPSRARCCALVLSSPNTVVDRERSGASPARSSALPPSKPAKRSSYSNRKKRNSPNATSPSIPLVPKPPLFPLHRASLHTCTLALLFSTLTVHQSRCQTLSAVAKSLSRSTAAS